MTTRQEFPAKVKDQADARANGHCQGCGLPFMGKKKHYDHILPDALGGKPILANCQVLCESCHKVKTGTEDVPRIRKADRQRRASNGASRPKQTIKSAGFPPTDKPAPKITKQPLPPRALYEDVK